MKISLVYGGVVKTAPPALRRHNPPAAQVGWVLAVPKLITLAQQGSWQIDVLGRTLDLSAMTSLTSTNGIFLQDTGGGTLLDSMLTTLSGVLVLLDGTDSQALRSFCLEGEDPCLLCDGPLFRISPIRPRPS